MRSSASDHRYKAGNEVPFYANKVGPFLNHSETYRYFDFPFCSSDEMRKRGAAPVKEKKKVFGEALNGDRLVSAPYKIDFLSEKDAKVACQTKFSKEDVAKFRNAVSEDYYFQMYYDDLPVWGFFGKISARTDPKAVINLNGDEPIDVDFMYTVKWKETDTPFEKMYTRDEESADDDDDDKTGWKYIYGDVFRYPKHNSLFAAALGSGIHLFTIHLCPYIWNCWLHCSFFLLSARRNKLVLGGIIGKNSKAEFEAPCHTTKCPREIPQLPWYGRTLPQMAMAGFFPFSATYIELYYILASVWGHRIYTIYSILFVAFIILLIVTAFITVALTYFQLVAEDHEWWWRCVVFGV
ncbi:P-loop containing nucleoside triphosphate hydrolases superfamily protein isoform 1 [Hibiscus syriacus]|uniref:Transmembrane 9 superfamily member n=1 Tax=Hibiscus syriacus TaxID=106335 RepID=A0A6A2WBI8_HIBSY|nr:P-loop containing nucleoside triphosphate hydrolases superfamily protein isoform 1 [Hibiscus syriacus]